MDLLSEQFPQVEFRDPWSPKVYHKRGRKDLVQHSTELYLSAS